MIEQEIIDAARAHGIDATRLSTVLSFASAIRRSALEEAAQIAHGYSLQAEKIIRALSQKTAQGEKNG